MTRLVLLRQRGGSRRFVIFFSSLVGFLLLWGGGTAWGQLPPSCEDADTTSFVLENEDQPGVGLNDLSEVSPVAGNPCQTLGAQRLHAIHHVFSRLEASMRLVEPVRVSMSFGPLPCSRTSAVLGQAGPAFAVNISGTDNPISLANQKFSRDFAPGAADIRASFNGDLGGAGCLPQSGWDLGLTGSAGRLLSFVRVFQHEVAHGLGFASSIAEDGRFQNRPSVYDRFIFFGGTQQILPDITTEAARAAALISDDLWWDGPLVRAAAGALPTVTGLDAAGRVRLFAPNPFDPGSSTSHFAAVLDPDALMEPALRPNPRDDLMFRMMEELGYDVVVQAQCGDGVVGGDEQCDGGVCCLPDCTFRDGFDCGTPCAPGACASGACVLSNAAEGTDCDGRGAGFCFLQATCDGAGQCVDRLRPEGTRCGGAPCSPELCDAAGTCAPTQAPAGTVCGASSGSACDATDTCDGSGNCRSLFAAFGTECGAPPDPDAPCAATEFCDGLGSCLLRFRPAGTPCGEGSLDPCGLQARCNGRGDCSTRMVAPGTPCSEAPTGRCDLVDVCGELGQCIVRVEASGVVCRSANGCDPGATCDGSGACVDLVPDPTCVACEGDRDCDDLSPCTEEVCSDAGTCLFTAIEDCCRNREDCPPLGACGVGVCDDNQCVVERRAGCCERDDDCASVACAATRCDVEAQACVTEAVPDCCTIDRDCTADDPCLVGTCANGACQFVRADNCCVSAGDCDDGAACTQDLCEGSVCVQSQIAGCGVSPVNPMPPDPGPSTPPRTPPSPPPPPVTPTPPANGPPPLGGAAAERGVEVLPLERDSGSGCASVTVAGETAPSMVGFVLAIVIACVRRRRTRS